MQELRICQNKDEWDELVEDYGGHPLQLWGWGQAKSSHGWAVERIALLEDEKIVAAAQMLIRKLPSSLGSFAYVPRGPLYKDVKDAHVLLELLAQRAKKQFRAIALSVESDDGDFLPPEDWSRATNTILPAETILLDLNRSESDLLADMAKKTRQYIRKSAAEVTIRQARSQEDIDDCLLLYEETAIRAGFARHGNQYYRDIQAQLRDHSPIFMAFEGDNPVAFLWLAVTSTTAYELYGGVSDRGQELRANYALKWHAIRKTKEWELSRYDFGGLIAGGVATFKQGWSSSQTTFGGTFDKQLSPLYVLWSKGLPFAKKIVRAVKRSR